MTKEAFEELIDKIDYEGGVSSGALGYFGEDLRSGDTRLDLAWRRAWQALETLQTILNEEEEKHL